MTLQLCELLFALKADYVPLDCHDCPDLEICADQATDQGEGADE